MQTPSINVPSPPDKNHVSNGAFIVQSYSNAMVQKIKVKGMSERSFLILSMKKFSGLINPLP